MEYDSENQFGGSIALIWLCHEQKHLVWIRPATNPYTNQVEVFVSPDKDHKWILIPTKLAKIAMAQISPRRANWTALLNPLNVRE